VLNDALYFRLRRAVIDGRRGWEWCGGAGRRWWWATLAAACDKDRNEERRQVRGGSS
jgi:hypothetical protein